VRRITILFLSKLFGVPNNTEYYYIKSRGSERDMSSPLYLSYNCRYMKTFK